MNKGKIWKERTYIAWKYSIFRDQNDKCLSKKKFALAHDKFLSVATSIYMFLKLSCFFCETLYDLYKTDITRHEHVHVNPIFDCYLYNVLL